MSCETERELRVKPLGIDQGVDCVTWGKLTALRQNYNDLIWTPLNTCGLTENVKFGAVPNQQETDDLPDVEGFFRLLVSTTQSPTGEWTSTVSDVSFLVTGGSYLDRLADPATWTYIDGEKDWYLIVTDA